MGSNSYPRYILAATGGSGSAFTLRLLYRLMQTEGETTCILSDNFFRVLKQETHITGLEADTMPEIVANFFQVAAPLTIKHRFRFSDYRDIGAEAASGSARFNGMVILPCSMKTLGGIAAGITSNLPERAADVCLKERRKLILCPRETPLSLIHIENMRTVTLAGGIIMPVSPGYYHRPTSLTDLYDFMCDRIFNHLSIAENVLQPWQGEI